MRRLLVALPLLAAACGSVSVPVIPEVGPAPDGTVTDPGTVETDAEAGPEVAPVEPSPEPAPEPAADVPAEVPGELPAADVADVAPETAPDVEETIAPVPPAAPVDLQVAQTAAKPELTVSVTGVVPPLAGSPATGLIGAWLDACPTAWLVATMKGQGTYDAGHAFTVSMDLGSQPTDGTKFKLCLAAQDPAGALGGCACVVFAYKCGADGEPGCADQGDCCFGVSCRNGLPALTANVCVAGEAGGKIQDPCQAGPDCRPGLTCWDDGTCEPGACQTSGPCTPDKLDYGYSSGCCSGWVCDLVTKTCRKP